jgi:hypothetical protein
MKKNYILSLGILLLGMPLSAQTPSKTDKKTPTETPKLAQEIVYCIDGAITKSPLDFLKINQENIYSIAIINDPAEISKTYGANFKSVIVVQTRKTPKPVEAVVNNNGSQAKVKKN